MTQHGSMLNTLFFSPGDIVKYNPVEHGHLFYRKEEKVNFIYLYRESNNSHMAPIDHGSYWLFLELGNPTEFHNRYYLKLFRSEIFYMGMHFGYEHHVERVRKINQLFTKIDV